MEPSRLSSVLVVEQTKGWFHEDVGQAICSVTGCTVYRRSTCFSCHHSFYMFPLHNRHPAALKASTGKDHLKKIDVLDFVSHQVLLA